MEFIRWGSTSPQKCKYYWGNEPMLSYKKGDCVGAFQDRFFLAPKKRGFYAFPLGLHNEQLLGSGGSVASGRYRYLRDANGNKIMVRPVDYYDECLDGWWVWSISYCSGNITPYYREFLEKMGENPDKVMIYSESPSGRYDPRVWLYKAYWGTNHEPRQDEERNVDLEVTYPLVVENKPHRFGYDGNIWHHFEKTYHKAVYDEKVYLDFWNQLSEKEKEDRFFDCYGEIDEYANYTTLIKPEDIIDKRGTWILTDMEVYQNVLDRVIGIYKHDKMRWMRYKSNHSDDCFSERDDFHGVYTGLPRHSFVTEDFEVFIEKLK